MAGIALYILTLLIELISLLCRFLLVMLVASFFLSRNVALAVAGLCAAAPMLYSLLVVSGLPSGALRVRRALHGRAPAAAEQALIVSSIERLPNEDGTRPRAIFVIDSEIFNACIAGTTLYVYKGALDSRLLPAVLAHELGHLRHGDGRLSLALRALVVPGAYWLEGALHLLLYGLRRALIWLINGLVSLLRLYPLVGVLQLLVNIFLVALPHYTVIFAMGGVGPRLLDFAWQRYFISREFAADAYAARRGQRQQMLRIFIALREELADVPIPWSARRTHPPLTQRIERLASGAERQIDTWLHDFDAQQPAATRPMVNQPPRHVAQRPNQRTAALVLVSISLALVLTLLIAASLTRPSASTRPLLLEATAGPTPTLGFALTPQADR